MTSLEELLDSLELSLTSPQLRSHLWRGNSSPLYPVYLMAVNVWNNLIFGNLGKVIWATV